MMNAKRKTWMTNLLIFLSVLGPGIITGSVDNDAVLYAVSSYRKRT